MSTGKDINDDFQLQRALRELVSREDHQKERIEYVKERLDLVMLVKGVLTHGVPVTNEEKKIIQTRYQNTFNTFDPALGYNEDYPAYPECKEIGKLGDRLI